MAIVKTDDKHYKAIANAIRNFGDIGDQTLYPDEMAEHIEHVYDNGHDVGRDTGYQEGYEDGKAVGGDTDAAYQQGVTDGKQAEYDRFWDGVQQNGNRTNYSGAFYGDSWNNETFQPKYDIKIVGSTCANSTFRETKIVGSLKDILNSLGIEIDTSRCTGFSYTFYRNESITEIPTIDMSASAAAHSVFAYNSALETIGVIFGENQTHTNLFIGCTALKNITATGVIAKTGLSFNQSPLTVKSMKSIISCLADLSGTAGEGVYSIQFSSACWDALEADSTAPDGGTWQDYVAFKLGWSI